MIWTALTVRRLEPSKPGPQDRAESTIAITQTIYWLIQLGVCRWLRCSDYI